jgi:hypothetical protein
MHDLRSDGIYFSNSTRSSSNQNVFTSCAVVGIRRRDSRVHFTMHGRRELIRKGYGIDFCLSRHCD